MTLNNESVVKKDRLRFTKNKFSANMTLLSIVFNAMYFVSIYKSNVGSYYYSYMMGISVIYNLVFMLAAFLSSEGVKSYKMGYSYLLILIGLAQIARVLIIPMKAHDTMILLSEVEEKVMSDTQFWWVTGCLLASAACCIIAGIVGIAKTTTLHNYQKELDKKR